MELVKHEVSVPKEISEIGDAVLLILSKFIVEKKEASAVLAEAMPSLIMAIEGFNKLGEEVKSKELYDFAGLFAANLVKLFVK